MRIGWLSVSRQVLRRRGGYGAMVLAVALAFAVAVLATGFAQRVAQHAHEMSALPPGARLQITASSRAAAAYSAEEDLSALRAVPGVRSASWVEAPLRTVWDRPELFEGPSGAFVGWVIPTDEMAVDTLGLHLVAGRHPIRRDASAVVVPLVVSRSFLAALGAGAGLGTRLRSVERGREAEIVGVVEDFLSHGQMKTSRCTVLWPMQPRATPVRTYLVRADEADLSSVVHRARDVLARPGRFVSVDETASVLVAMNRPMLRASNVLLVLEAIVVATLLLGLAAAAAFRA